MRALIAVVFIVASGAMLNEIMFPASTGMARHIRDCPICSDPASPVGGCEVGTTSFHGETR